MGQPPLNRQTLDLSRWDGLEPANSDLPDTVVHHDGFWSTTDGEELYWQSWEATHPGQARGVVALVHGYHEHGARFSHVAAALVAVGYDVMAIDLRGHGRSTGRRGFVERFGRYADDVALLKRRALHRFPDRPLFLMGHSNGGLVTLRYALRKPSRICGFVVSNPLIELAADVSRIKQALGRLSGRLLPRLSLPSGVDPAHLSHLPQVVRNYEQDPLVFGEANARWFLEMERASSDLQARAAHLDQPFLFVVGSDDRIVDAGATEHFFHQLGSMDRELEVYPDLFHELLNEAQWKTVLSHIVIWMERHRTWAGQ